MPSRSFRFNYRVKKSSTTIYCEKKAKIVQAGHVKEAGYR